MQEHRYETECSQGRLFSCSSAPCCSDTRPLSSAHTDNNHYRYVFFSQRDGEHNDCNSMSDRNTDRSISQSDSREYLMIIMLVSNCSRPLLCKLTDETLTLGCLYNLQFKR